MEAVAVIALAWVGCALIGKPQPAKTRRAGRHAK